jgi:hypothetical protein
MIIHPQSLMDIPALTRYHISPVTTVRGFDAPTNRPFPTPR